MPPQLIVAESAYTAYPGKIVALKCDEWMGDARGTLSAEDDLDAITGRIVRDTQQSTTEIFDSITSAFNEVDDTLTIDVSGLPLEPRGSFARGMTYKLWLSLRIEGDWDPTESKQTRSGTQDNYGRACEITWYDSTYETVTTGTLNLHRANYRPRKRPNYIMVGLGNFASGSSGLVGDEVIHLRAWGAPDSTCEILLDQLFIVPHVTFEIRYNEWSALDWAFVPGNWMDQISFEKTIIDGADGGDANGKFTWFPRTIDGSGQFANLSGGDGGGDYQTDDSEYMVQVFDVDVPIQITATEPVGSFPSTAIPRAEHAYSIHGANLPNLGVWVNDTFSRTVSPAVKGNAWGLTPEGYAWECLNLVGSSHDHAAITFSANGSQGVIDYNFSSSASGPLLAFVGLGKVRQFALSTAGARVASWDVSFKGEFEVSNISHNTCLIYLILGNANAAVSGRGNNAFHITFNAVAKTWQVQEGGTGTGLHSAISASWFGAGSRVGYRIETRRHRIRARVWDASGAEPSTWGFDGFMPWNQSGTLTNYPYSDNPYTANNIQFPRSCDIETELRNTAGTPTVATIYFDNIEIRWDTEETTDPESVHALIEFPEGTERGRIEIPGGAWHIVHWGGRQWAIDFEGTRDYAIDIAAKVWNDPAARELQRSEVPFWWFRTIHGGPIDLSKLRFRAHQHEDDEEEE